MGIKTHGEVAFAADGQTKWTYDNGVATLVLDGVTVTPNITSSMKLAAGVPVTHIADPSGGATVDTEARAAIVLIIDALEAFNIDPGA